MEYKFSNEKGVISSTKEASKYCPYVDLLRQSGDSTHFYIGNLARASTPNHPQSSLGHPLDFDSLTFHKILLRCASISVFSSFTL